MLSSVIKSTLNMNPLSYYDKQENIEDFSMHDQLLNGHVLLFGLSPLDLLKNFPKIVYQLLKVNKF